MPDGSVSRPKNANSTKLQVFRGSFFTNRESWTALGGTALFSPPIAPYQPETYSWFDYANALGYPTLALDTFGDGASSRPDGLLVTQLPYDTAAYHDLVTQIRAGITGQLLRAYSYLVHIGNSLGSTTGNWMAACYPEDFDAMVLTGYSNAVDLSLAGVSLNLPLPAVLQNATRFAGVPLDYVTSSVEASLTNSFFGNPSVVDFDPEMAHLFFERRDVVSLGDVLSQYLPGNAPFSPKYKGRVLVLTGENDQAFCGLGSSLISPNTMCGSLLKDTGSLFPAADYNYQSISRTGHAIILHKSAQQTFKVAHDFIAGASFGA
nr:hypothetical protein CFP56_37111 [Quercus suber]